MTPQPDQSVRGVCPSCGTALLFLGEGGYVTCSLHNCPDPTAADRLLFSSRAIFEAFREVERKATGLYVRSVAREALDSLASDEGQRS